MIQTLVGWAVDSWHEVEARAVMLGLTARVGGPDSVLDLDARHFLAFLEGIVREDEGRRKTIDEVYEKSRPVDKTPLDRSARHREIERLTRIFGG
ncbi:hypothetical protein [Amycolatopsis sp. PS_44_ISF1]|uniref:hypothetical protein n=1 Tax=Amycolatopsis sp. PS_44_ISF1 TaxID=2974917 RepID=UPI0028DFC12D|nr:hypothetical protein [Amycolatopsis sp. PS_44_ISF1]MDT8915762.1 hypothetical protein [Amycolatopsis sp. PS_44_ISF1]MDT8916294.1 hypothetical protein [Amycolatopsis sp. PS_44_ISF1]MDT8916303.1 hypothetical protein [Amycolatopsis sp. PS_44_ISF1]